MKNSLKEMLFSKHILVAEKDGSNQIEVLYSLLNKLNVRITEGFELANIDVFEFCADQLGRNIPSAFYRGFPESVRRLNPDEHLMDQVLHYVRTYGFGDFSEAGHSLFERAIARSPFKEDDEPKQFRILSEEAAVEVLKELQQSFCDSSRPLNENQIAFILDVMVEYSHMPESISCKETVCELLRETWNLEFVKYLQLHDVIKLVDTINWKDHHNEKLNKLHFSNLERKFIARVLDKILENRKTSYDEVKTCVEKRQVWMGLLHHIHYKPSCPNGKHTIAAIYNEDIRSDYSRFERAMKTNPVEAAEILKHNKGNGALLRNLNYILSKTDDVDAVLALLEAKSPIVIMQMQNMYRMYNSDPRFFKFYRHERIRTHKELERSFVLSEDKRNKAIDALELRLRDTIAGKVGKVYIAPGMENIAVPMNMSASETGFGILPTGSRIKLPEGKKIRAFTYWEKVNDIDLACFGINEDGSRNEFSWRTMYYNQSDAITYSGDQTSGYHGGSEYFDIDFEKVHEMYPDMKYMVFTNNVYSGVDFANVVCRAGWMSRDVLDSGEVYEPKTVQSAYTINAKTTFAYLYAIDIEKREVIWLNVCDAERARVAETKEFDWLYSYFETCNVMNMRKLFTYAATEVVDDPEDADLVIGDIKTEKEQIRSYEFEKALAYLK